MTHPDDRYSDLYHRATARALREVADDIGSGLVPLDVACFSDLHSHVDANDYGGLTTDNAVDIFDAAGMGIANAIQSTVSVVLNLTYHLDQVARPVWLRSAADHLSPATKE